MGIDHDYGKENCKDLLMPSRKSRLVSFNRWEQAKGKKQGTFDFLGFTFYIAPSKSGKMCVKVKTNRKRLRSKLAKIKDWVKRNRNVKLVDLWHAFTLKLRGHLQYFAVSGNDRAVKEFFFKATRIFFSWMNRRSQRKSFTWKQFSVFVHRFPLPKVRIQISLYKSQTSL